MLKKLNIQYFLSYLGVVPYILVLTDKYFFLIFKEEIYLDFIIYYTLIIIVFIGSTNWDLRYAIKSNLVIYGFLPSLFSSIIILLNLYNFTILYIFYFLYVMIFLQLVFDYYLIYSDDISKKSFYYVRMPLSISIIINLIIIIK